MSHQYFDTATPLSEIMNDTVVVNSSSSVDKYGRHSFSASSTSYTNCRVQVEKKRTQDAEGNDIWETGVVYIVGDANIVIGDKVTLPDGQTPVVIDVKKVADEVGVHNTVVRFA